MTAPVPQPSDAAERISFAAGLAVARARRGLLTVAEIRAALDEAYRMGQAAALAASPAEEAVKRVEALADSLDVDSCDPMPDDRSRLMFETAQRIRAALAAAALTADAALAGQHTTDEEAHRG